MTMERLNADDLINLAVETPETPVHIGAFLLVDGRDLCDNEGRLRLAEIRGRIERRLGCAPQLRRVIHHAGPFTGRPLWVDDQAFRIDRHVRSVRLTAPTDREGLLQLATQLVTRPMDRTHPLWRVWLVHGLADGRIAVVVALHHVLADGVAAIHMITSLLGARDEPSPVPDLAWGPRPAPRWRDVVVDNARSMMAAWRCIGATKAGPDGRRARDSVAAFWTGLARAWRAPRTSLNAPVRAGRRLAAVDLTVAEAREVAHVYSAKINDVILTLAAGGVRALLASRGERIDRLQVHANVAVSLRKPGSTVDAGNQTGGIVVRLPLGEPDPRRRLRTVAAECRDAKRHQLHTGGNRMLVSLARIGLLRVFSRRQRMVNFVASNVAGPPTTIHLLDAPVLDIVPIGSLVGNVGLSFLAVSYAGRLTIAVQCDARRFPDLRTITDAMNSEWRILASSWSRTGGCRTS